MRYAIFCAVSTEAQAAADKISLPAQEELCKKAVDLKGWQDTELRYIVPGESRTRFINLRDAEQAIPELKSMLDAAQNHKFDILVMVNYNRLRDLLDPVSKTLSHYGIQLYSLSQPVEPLDPKTYSPYDSDTPAMMQSLSHLISVTQINDLQRKFKTAMPRRITDRGLHANNLPWGYRKPPGRETDRAAVPIQEPDKCAVILQAKDLLFTGQSLKQLCEYFTASGISPPHGGAWWPQTVRGILRNPYYAGVVRFGATKTHIDPRTGIRIYDRKNPQRAITGIGKHIPLWDIPTHQDIIKEFSRRQRSFRGRKNNQFTGLIHCGECGLKLWMTYHGWRSEEKPGLRTWRCSSDQPHRWIHHDDLVEQVGHELVISIRSHLDNPSQTANKPVDIKDLAAQRSRLEDAYQAGLMTLESFSTRVAELDAQELLASDQAALNRDQSTRLALLQRLADNIDSIPGYLSGGDPREINRLLHILLSKIILNDNNIELIYR